MGGFAVTCVIFQQKKPHFFGGFFCELSTDGGGRSPRQKYYNKIPKHEKMKCGIIEEDYKRTNEKRLIGVTSTDKPYCNRNPCERYSCCFQALL